MANLPSSLALTTIGTGADILSADHRNNYAALQAAFNALLTALGGGGGPVIAPGYIYDYQQITANVTTTATTEGGAQAVATSAPVTYDGSTIIMVEFWCPAVSHTVTGSQVILTLFEDATVLGRARASVPPDGATQGTIKRRRTPSAGSHTYTVKAHGNAAGTSTVAAGAGGSGTDLQAFIQIVKQA